MCDFVKHMIIESKLSKLRLLNILDRLNLLSFYWLSPELSGGEDMVKLSKNFVSSGYQFLNMLFHSTSLFPGKSPFVSDEVSLVEFFDKIETFLQYAHRNNFEFLPLSDAVPRVERH